MEAVVVSGKEICIGLSSTTTRGISGHVTSKPHRLWSCWSIFSAHRFKSICTTPPHIKSTDVRLVFDLSGMACRI